MRSNDMKPQIQELLDFHDTINPREWFVRSDEFDSLLKKKYSSLVEQARSNELDTLEESAEGSLALLILLDQIPRNIFRGSHQSYSSDSKAQGIALRAIAKDFDRKIGQTSSEKQLIFYLPLMHAEDLLSQIACRALMWNVALQYPEGSEKRNTFQSGMTVADEHLDCILKLGRFPARNSALGRAQSIEEDKWLRNHPQGY